MKVWSLSDSSLGKNYITQPSKSSTNNKSVYSGCCCLICLSTLSQRLLENRQPFRRHLKSSARSVLCLDLWWRARSFLYWKRSRQDPSEHAKGLSCDLRWRFSSQLAPNVLSHWLQRYGNGTVRLLASWLMGVVEAVFKAEGETADGIEECIEKVDETDWS